MVAFPKFRVFPVPQSSEFRKSLSVFESSAATAMRFFLWVSLNLSLSEIQLVHELSLSSNTCNTLHCVLCSLKAIFSKAPGQRFFNISATCENVSQMTAGWIWQISREIMLPTGHGLLLHFQEEENVIPRNTKWLRSLILSSLICIPSPLIWKWRPRRTLVDPTAHSSFPVKHCLIFSKTKKRKRDFGWNVCIQDYITIPELAQSSLLSVYCQNKIYTYIEW